MSTTVDLSKLTEEVKPTLEAIVEQTDGLVTFDPAGVRHWQRADGSSNPAIAWWVNDDNEFYVDMPNDLRAEVAKGLRSQAAQLIEAADALEGAA